MRVSLLHNSRSGSKDHTADEIAHTIRRFGHEVVGVAHSLGELGSALKRDETELIAIAGGDGTVSRTACALAGSAIPLAILPHGTANNTALSLGIRGTVEQIIDSWQRASLVPFDLLDAAADGHTTRFAEAMGWGVFPQVIAEAMRREKSAASSPNGNSDGAVRSLDDERALFREVVERARPRSYEVEVDGVNYSGEYLLVEISNVRFIGPQLLLAPGSSTKDGLIEVTLWGSAERDHLLRSLDSDESIRRVAKGPAARVGDHVSVSAVDALRHVDGHLVDLGESAREMVRFSVRRAAVHYLIGP
jgi:diacylglycerol kinase (ATP)